MDSKDDELDVAAKDWSRIVDAAAKTGYRDGVEDGSEAVYQDGFDRGYEDAFQTAFILGKYKSLLNASTECPEDIREALDKTRRGACRICQLESAKIDVERMPFAEVVQRQKEHTQEVLGKVERHFRPVVERLRMDTLNVGK